MHAFLMFFYKSEKNMFLCFFLNLQINVFNIYVSWHDGLLRDVLDWKEECWVKEQEVEEGYS